MEQDKPLKVFPAGTNVKDVDVVDRGQKMIFTCEEHCDTAQYASKNPSHSTWFPADRGIDCGCSIKDPVWVLVVDYKPTRND